MVYVSAYVVSWGCGGGLITGRMFRCLGLGDRVDLGGIEFSGCQGGSAAWRQVSHLPVRWWGLHPTMPSLSLMVSYDYKYSIEMCSPCHPFMNSLTQQMSVKQLWEEVILPFLIMQRYGTIVFLEDALYHLDLEHLLKVYVRKAWPTAWTKWSL